MSWRRSSVPPQAQIAAEHEVRRLTALLGAARRETNHQASIVADVRQILYRNSERRIGDRETVRLIGRRVGYYLHDAGLSEPQDPATDGCRTCHRPWTECEC